MATHWIWTGSPTHDSIRIKARVDGGSARLALSPVATMDDASFTSAETPDAQGIVVFQVNGLEPGSRHFVAIEDDGSLDVSWVGRFRTHPVPAGEPQDQRIVSWSCAGLRPDYPGHSQFVSNSPALDIITDELEPDLLVQTGDLHYYDIDTNDVTRYRNAFEAVLHRTNTPRLSRHLAMNPNVYMWDDHDYGPNDSDGTHIGRPSAVAAYRQYVPHNELPSQDGPIYRAQQIGRVLHMFSDVRHDRSPNGQSDNINKTMLGAEQLAWMEELLSESTAEFLVWYMPSQWQGISVDSWSRFTSERRILAQMLGAPGGDSTKSWLHRMVQISGDVHALAMDDGSGNDWGGFPVYVCASIDSDYGGPQFGLYWIDGERTYSSPGRRRYGVLDITDHGDSIEIDFGGYINRWRKFHHNWTVQLDVTEADDFFQATEIEAFADINWSEGEYFGTSASGTGTYERQTLTDWAVERELATDLPDEMQTVSGLAISQASATVAAPSGSTVGHWSPWRTPLRYLNAPVRFSVSADGVEYPMFVGTTESAGSDRDGVELDITALDRMKALDAPVELPSFGAEMGPEYNPGLSAEWIVEHVLSSFGDGALWERGPDPMLHSSLAGSSMSNLGNWHRTSDPQGANVPPTFQHAYDMPYSVPTTMGSRIELASTEDNPEEAGFFTSSGWTIGHIAGDPPQTNAGLFRASIFFSPPGRAWSRWMRVMHEVDGSGVRIGVGFGDSNQTYTYHYFEDCDLGPYWVTCTPVAGVGMRVRLYQQTQPPRQVTGSFGVNLGTAGHEVRVVEIRSYDAAPLGWQMLRGSSYEHAELPWYEGLTERISVPDVNLRVSYIESGVTGKEVLQQLAAAELGAFWINEEGRAVFRSRSDLRAPEERAIQVRSEVSLLDPGNWTTNIDQTRSAVEIPVAFPRVLIAPTSWIELWQAEDVFTVHAGETLDITVRLDAPGGGIPGVLWASGVTGGCWMELNRARDGSGTRIMPNQGNAGRVFPLGPDRVRVIWHNPYPYALHFVNGDGDPAFVLSGRWTVQEGSELEVREETGAKGTILSLDANTWRQDLLDAQSLARWLSEEVAAPRPFLEDIRVAFDPRIKLGSVIVLNDPDVYGVDIRCLVRGIKLSADAGSIEQRLSVQPLRLNLADLDSAWQGTTLQSIDVHWDGMTLAHLDHNPREGGPYAVYT